jgi:hypothetical protein
MNELSVSMVDLDADTGERLVPLRRLPADLTLS